MLAMHPQSLPGGEFRGDFPAQRGAETRQGQGTEAAGVLRSASMWDGFNHVDTWKLWLSNPSPCNRRKRQTVSAMTLSFSCATTSSSGERSSRLQYFFDSFDLEPAGAHVRPVPHTLQVSTAADSRRGFASPLDRALVLDPRRGPRSSRGRSWASWPSDSGYGGLGDKGIWGDTGIRGYG